MAHTVLDEEWGVVANFLPSDWRELARSEGAIRRERGVTDPDALLRLLLLHVATGLSLRQTVARARVLGWPSMSDVALLKRLRTSEAWFREVAARMYGEGRRGRRTQPVTTRRLRAVDATTVEEPGATGTDWRVHYSIQLPKLACDHYEVTDVKGGETYKRFPVEKGDIILGDRGYSHRDGVAHVVRHGGDVVVRLNITNFPLSDRRGRRFNLLARLRTLKGHSPMGWPVTFTTSQGEQMSARVCAVRKTVEAAEQAKQRAAREASKKGRNLRPDTLEFAEYIFVLTTVPKAELSVRQVLQLYRTRWQIELVFKRLKSLLQLGHVPKKNDESARAWIQAKLLLVMLAERMADEARFFSPWGFELCAS